MALNDPNWGRRGNDGPPDLDELWNRLRQKLGSTCSAARAAAPRRRDRARARWAAVSVLLIVLVLLVWLASGFYIVDASQRGVVLRFGKFLRDQPSRARAGICPIRSNRSRSST